jgi:hypothetical protein
MAETTSLSDEVRSASLPTEAQPTATPLQGLTTSLGLLPSYMQAGAKEVSGIRESVGRERTASEELGAAAAAQKQAADAARPDAVKLTQPPSLAARPFLAPGEGMLAQLQTALLGATQMALGVGGLKGGGHAIAAVAGMKGALEGWIAGDHDRANAALKEWDANSKKLLEEHRTRREAYADLLTDMKMDMANRLAQIGINARIDGRVDLANAAERGQIKDVIDILGANETHERDFAVKIAVLKNSIANHQETAARADRVHADLQRQRGIVNQRAAAASARAEDYATFRKETSVNVFKLQSMDLSLDNKLKTADIVEEAVGVLAANKMLPTGPTTPDAARAWMRKQTAFNDTRVKWAIDMVERQGTGLVVGSEIALGEPASVMRLRAIAEPQAGHILTAGAEFWKTFFDRYRPFLKEQRTMVRDHLQQIGRLPAEPAEAGWTAEPVE